MNILRLRRGSRAPVVEPAPLRPIDSLATWWCQATPGTTYVRAAIPAKYLPGRLEMLDTSSLQLDEHGDPFVFGQDGYASIWQFPGNATRAIIMAELQSQGHKVLVEVDDNYLVPPPGPTSWSLKLDRTREDNHSFAAHRKIVKWCDGVIVTTPTVAEHYAEATDAPIYVCPNSFDPDDWPKWPERPEGPVRVGFAGSSSHIYDLMDVADALDWAHRDGAALVKMGASSHGWRWPHTQVPWENTPSGYRRTLTGAFDIGLCPLRRGSWQDCKSDLKAIEYLAAGILPVVQGDSPVYADWVGVVPHASTRKQWVKVVRELVALEEHERLALFNDAYAWMLDNKMIDDHIDKWREAVA